MLSIPLVFSILIASMVISYWGIFFLLKYLAKNSILDIPNERSNHKVPTPRGAGLALLASVTLLWPVFGAYFIYSFEYNLIMTTAVAILGVVSFMDDKKPLKPGVRLGVHIAVASFTIFLLMPQRNVLLPENVPVLVEKLMLIICMAYFVNIYNFMDGIDGITAVNTITVLLGMSVFAYVSGIGENYIYLSGLIIGFCFAFLIFNWHPAKIFLGDVGSVPLGYLVGAFALYLAYHGYLWQAMLINAYYILDATITILIRLKNKENILEAHSKHFYQKAVRSGKFTVKQASLGVGMINLVLASIAIGFKFMI
ncbi:MAG: glycosyltransferase family 4 protein [Alphaproteobacteria bacterium]|nr:glycosyltransferase family 4 protein [Alphaproteobacteria bacterium]OJV12114.1 MAG: hypothetical protein BGO27_05175 [Alphaproteobacteria bacterium 33-17]